MSEFAKSTSTARKSALTSPHWASSASALIATGPDSFVVAFIPHSQSRGCKAQSLVWSRPTAAGAFKALGELYPSLHSSGIQGTARASDQLGSGPQGSWEQHASPTPDSGHKASVGWQVAGGEELATDKGPDTSETDEVNDLDEPV